MKRLKQVSLLLGLALVVVLFVMAGRTWFSYSGTTMTIEDAETKWGSRPLDRDLFREGTTEDRASMAANIVRSQVYLRQPIQKVLDELGRPNSYFFSDEVPAYLLQKRSEQTPKTWKLVFNVDAHHRVSNVFIHGHGSGPKIVEGDG